MNSLAVRRRTPRVRGGLLAESILLSIVLSSCAATTFDESIATSTTEAAASPAVPAGSVDELLRELASALNGLSGLIGPDSSGRTPAGKADRILLIEGIWEAVRGDVASSDSEAADSIGRMVDLARTAVERNRPADADKAARFAGQVIDRLLAVT